MKYSLIFTLFTCFLFQQVHAKTSVLLMEEVNRCAIIPSNKDRLICFDKLTKKEESKEKHLVKIEKVKAKVRPKPPQKIIKKAAKKVTVSLEDKVDDFAKIHIKKSKEERDGELVSITLTISKLKKLLRGQWVIYFDNGQKWQQKDTVKLKLKVGDEVTLKKGVLNAIYLKKTNSNSRIRVRRIK